MTYARDEIMLERLLLACHIDVPLEHIEAWSDRKCQHIERWCVNLTGLHETDGIVIASIPHAISNYARSYP